ncbi:hypothetical protein GCM10017786_08450 [Amycolatopsis deserti]|uniref:DUF35 domain-containing protein n=1 Tax=Amycolatopsis deserti TaxID=185696 RepID=A0ABQ3IDP4_9PSEU|nr:OB-fold domain-containing protein [Amycolatopsis deserti]GHE80586.1 hypothetical protein GCM10017786_08450 [Amycolatopsis deserti]
MGDGLSVQAEYGLGDWIHEPLEDLDPDQIVFWDGLKDHVFKLCRCTACGTWYWPLTLCRNHGGVPEPGQMEWAPSSGRGTIFARVIVHQVTDPQFAGEVPYGLIVVELEEGPLFVCRMITKGDPYDARIGDEVEVVYCDSDQAGHTLPLFAPVREWN